MMRFAFFIVFFCLSFTFSFAQNPAEPIADQVMEAMGGEKNYNRTRYIKWDFFGRRLLLWDKYTGNVRIEVPEQKMYYLINVNSKKGQAMIGDTPIKHSDSLAKAMNDAYEIWINDSYWLVMPFKLRDPGVNLSLLESGNTEDGRGALILEMTFDGVGPYPEHKYRIWVDEEKNLVTQWAFFKLAGDEEPQFITPWKGYARYGKILLSGDRGRAQLKDIKVYKKLPKEIFSSFSAAMPK